MFSSSHLQHNICDVGFAPNHEKTRRKLTVTGDIYRKNRVKGFKSKRCHLFIDNKQKEEKTSTWHTILFIY